MQITSLKVPQALEYRTAIPITTQTANNFFAIQMPDTPKVDPYLDPHSNRRHLASAIQMAI